MIYSLFCNSTVLYCTNQYELYISAIVEHTTYYSTRSCSILSASTHRTFMWHYFTGAHQHYSIHIFERYCRSSVYKFALKKLAAGYIHVAVYKSCRVYFAIYVYLYRSTVKYCTIYKRIYVW